MYQGTSLASRVAEGFAVRDDAMRQAGAMSAEMQAANRDADVSPRCFEQEARRIARLRRERYALGFVDDGGWAHMSARGARGLPSNQLEKLGRGLAGMADRSMLGGLFARRYGLDAACLEAVFPGARPRDIGLVCPGSRRVTDRRNGATRDRG